MSYDFTGRVAVVTGGSKGMGYAVAETMLAAGASVAICSNDAASLEEAASTLRGPIHTEVADVRVADDMTRFIAKAAAKFGGIDYLVNNAGVQRYGSVVETSEALWDEVIDINLKGIFLASKAAIPEIEQRGGGAIVNISSVQAFASQTSVAAYSASKGAINALTRAMALDHAKQNIRVNTVCPGAIDTPMLRWAADLFKGDKPADTLVEAWGRAHPLGRLGRPSEVADTVTFLLSPKAAFITGAEIKVDGGVLAKLGIIIPE